MASHLGAGIELIGLGTGAGTKTRILPEKLRDPAVLCSGRYFQRTTGSIRGFIPATLP
jgi:hypothetical protein